MSIISFEVWLVLLNAFYKRSHVHRNPRNPLPLTNKSQISLTDFVTNRNEYTWPTLAFQLLFWWWLFCFLFFVNLILNTLFVFIHSVSSQTSCRIRFLSRVCFFFLNNFRLLQISLLFQAGVFRFSVTRFCSFWLGFWFFPKNYTVFRFSKFRRWTALLHFWIILRFLMKILHFCLELNADSHWSYRLELPAMKKKHCYRRKRLKNVKWTVKVD